MLRFLSYASGSDEPVSAGDAMLACRLDDVLEPQVVAAIAAARQHAEQITGRAYRKQVQRDEFADWPIEPLMLPVWQPVSAVVSYRSAAQPDQWTVLSSTVYRFGAFGSGSRLALATGQTWPELATEDWGARVRVDITCGPAGINDVPECVRTFILANVAAMVDQPAALTSRDVAVNPLTERLLDRERVWA